MDSVTKDGPEIMQPSHTHQKITKLVLNFLIVCLCHLKFYVLQSVNLILNTWNNQMKCIVAIRSDQLDFREHGFFSKFEGSVGRSEKEENKKKSPIFCVGFDYQ